MQAHVNLRFPRHFINSKQQMMTTSGYMFESFELKTSWYKDIANRIYKKSQELCPVDTGALKKSGRVRMNSDGTYRVEYKALYAVFVHEIMGLNHKTPTQSKFLEDAAYLVLEDFYSATGNIIPLFTFHLEMSIGNGIALYIDNISMGQFLHYVADTRGVNSLDDLD